MTSAVPALAPANLRGNDESVALPSSLVPLRGGPDAAIGVSPFPQQGPANAVRPLSQRVGTPLQIVQACRTSVVQAAIPYGAVRVDAVSAGRLSRTRDGGLAAPIEVRVVYARSNANQARQSQITCRLDASGAVVALRS